MQTLPAKVRKSLVAAVSASALVALCTATSVQAQRVTSNEPAGYLIFPKIVVQTTPGLAVDTLIQLTNTSNELVYVNCWYVDGTKRCDNTNAACNSDADCQGGICQAASCDANDFQLQLTPNQPVAWRASTGSPRAPCSIPTEDYCDTDPPPRECTECDVTIFPAISIPNVSTIPFQGELKCVQVASDGSDEPIVANDLKGEATIYRVASLADPPMTDTASYNAIGVQSQWGACSLSNDACTRDGDCPADEVCWVGRCSDDASACGVDGDCTAGTCDAINDGDRVLRLGGDNPEYAGCPGVLILDHFFDGAVSPVNGANNIRSDLTLVPCTENLLPVAGDPTSPTPTTAQMLVYNEFEQRFSTSQRVECYYNSGLSNIDTRPDPKDDPFSLFAIGVQGTIVGQTRIRGVQTLEAEVGHGLLAVAEEVHGSTSPPLSVSRAAFNVGQFAERSQGDVVRLSVPVPPVPDE